jgi:hypothetical protein
MTITLEFGPFFTFVVRSATGQARPVEKDADFPKVAATFGWSGRRDKSPESVWDAYECLEEHVCTTAHDSGIF